jgi:hypothetical protein
MTHDFNAKLRAARRRPVFDPFRMLRVVGIVVTNEDEPSILVVEDVAR